MPARAALRSFSGKTVLDPATGKRVYHPSNGRKPIEVDLWHVILKRTKTAQRLRGILYGLPPGSYPPVPRPLETDGRVTREEASYQRLSQWAFLVREFVRQRDFRYVDLLQEARRFREKVGDITYPEVQTAWEDDLLLLKTFQRYLYDRRRELETWRNRPDYSSPEFSEEMAAVEVKRLLLTGVCPLCGEDLPCRVCDVPEYVLDGKGGILPKTWVSQDSPRR